MKTKLWSLVASSMLALGSAMAQELDPPAPAPEKETVVEGERETFFTTRYLRVKNETKETMTVLVQYRTLVKGEWTWLPGEPDDGKALSFEVPAGADMLLEDGSDKIAASRVRIWTTGAKQNWLTHRDKDLWLVPEVSDEQHRYKAASMETFVHAFAELPMGEPAEPMPLPPVDPFPLPEPPLPPLPLDPVPPPPDLPPMPAPKDADLGLTSFNVDKTGAFAATIKNHGPSHYIFGRQWFLLRYNKAKASYEVEKKGLIPPLFALGKKDIAGNVGPIAATSKFILAISGGDGTPSNDKLGPVFVFVAPKADLAVSNLKLVGDLLEGTITNLGPDDYKFGPRSFTLGNALAPVKSKVGKVAGLAKGASVKVSMDVKDLLDLKAKFYLKLSAGDDNAANDAKEMIHEPEADLAVTDLHVAGKFLVGKITNNGPAAYKGVRTFNLGSPLKSTSAAIKDLNKGQSQVVLLNIDSVDHLKQTFTLKLSAGDAHPLNNLKSLAYDPPAKPADLAVESIKRVGMKVTVVVKNVGGVKSGAGRMVTIAYEVPFPKSWKNVKSEGIAPLDPGATQVFHVNIPLPTDARATINHVPGDAAANDQKETP